MNCPHCGTLLEELRRGDVVIDACRTCRGVWLDHGELAAYVSHLAGGRPGPLGAERFETTPIGDRIDCPRCARAALRTACRGGLRLAKCPACLGLWLPEASARLLVKRPSSRAEWTASDTAWAGFEGLRGLLEIFLLWPS